MIRVVKLDDFTSPPSDVRVVDGNHTPLSDLFDSRQDLSVGQLDV